MALGEIVAIIAGLGGVGLAAVTILNDVRLKRKEFTQTNYEDIKAWYEETIKIEKDLFINHYKDNDESLEKQNLLSALSSQIDIGRMYFPNMVYDNQGNNKAELFRGHRVITIDLLLLFYDIMNNNKAEENYLSLKNVHRAWISEMSLYLRQFKNKNATPKYELVDKCGILLYENLNNKEFKEICEKDDIVKLVKEANEQKEQNCQKGIEKCASKEEYVPFDFGEDLVSKLRNVGKVSRLNRTQKTSQKYTHLTGKTLEEIAKGRKKKKVEGGSKEQSDDCDEMGE